MEIRKLRRDDDRSRFRSGVELDRFFQRYAGQNQFRHHLGTTYVASEGRRIVGFFTVCPGHIEATSLPAALARRLPRYPLPILRLARLAVDQSCRDQGVGAELLRAVFELALRMADELGCVGVAVDAKAGAEGFYARYGFTTKEVAVGGMRGSPAPTTMFISTATLAIARPPER